jgi:diguanylate cyclase (GGDEF)-like protein/PAS domain S-box-containing protein
MTELPNEGPVHTARLELGERWTKALTKTAYSPMARRKIRRHLDEHLAVLVDALAATPFAPDPAAAVGEWLVRARFTGQSSLRRTVELLGPALRVLPELDGVDQLTDRVFCLLGELASAYTNAVRRQIFTEQEKVRDSLLLTVEEMQQDLHDSEARFRQVFSSSAVGIAILGLDGKVVEVNPALVAMLKQPPEQPPDQVLTAKDLAALQAVSTLMLIDGDESFRAERQFTDHTGDTMWANVVLSVVRDAEGVPKYYVAVIEDITDQRVLREYLRHQALHDVLTGLPNRESFVPRLEEVLSRLEAPRSITLCYLDVDSMTIVNDGLGYQAGDTLLTEVARRLTAVVADEIATVARIGGDEFVLLVEDGPGTPSISALADTIDRELSEPVYLGDHGVSASASMGFVRTSSRGLDALALLRQAHSTLRRAEAGGKRQWGVYDADQDALERPRLTLVAAMPGALENGEIVIDYLPVVRLADQELVAFTARMRWEHRELGVVHHDECLRYADELGLSGPLARWLLGDACAHARRMDAPLIVRLSADQSRDPDLCAVVSRSLQDSGLPADRLWLSLAVRGVRADATAEDNLTVLADMGVRRLLHGFGGGLSELSIVDRHVPQGVELESQPEGRLNLAGVAALVPLIHSAGTVVVVDDIGTGDRAARYREIGVDLAVQRV